MKWYELDDVCPICGRQEDDHRSNCPNNLFRNTPKVKKIKNETYD